MEGYTQINVIYTNKLNRRIANQCESNSPLTNKVHDTNLMRLVLLDLKKLGNLSFITFGHTKKLNSISRSLHFNALNSS